MRICHNIRGKIHRTMAKKVSERFPNLADSQIPLQGQYKRSITQIAKAFFRTALRQVNLNRKEMRFDILVVDANETLVKEFIEEYPMCYVENTFSEIKAEVVK